MGHKLEASVFSAISAFDLEKSNKYHEICCSWNLTENKTKAIARTSDNRC